MMSLGDNFLTPFLKHEYYDNLEPFFSLPLGREDDGKTTTTSSLDFYLPSATMWATISVVLSFFMIFTAIISLVLYKFCLEQQPQQHKPKTSSSSASSTTKTTSIIFAYGFVLPFWYVAPSYIGESIGITSLVIRFAFSNMIPTLGVLRTLAVVHGYAPKHAQGSLGAFMLWYVFPWNWQYDDKTGAHVKTTPKNIATHLWNFLKSTLSGGIVLSVAMMDIPQLSFLFPKMGQHTRYDGRLWTTFLFVNPFDVQKAIHNFMSGLFLMLLIFMFTSFVQTGQEIIVGIQTESCFKDNPFLDSYTPSEFWGRRWNVIIHDALKRGVYKPVRSVFPKIPQIAVLATFIVSGLIHEIIWINLFPPYQRENTNYNESNGLCERWTSGLGVVVVEDRWCYEPATGFTLLYFLAQFCFVVLDVALTTTTKKGDNKIQLPFCVRHREAMRFVWIYAMSVVTHWMFHTAMDSTLYQEFSVIAFRFKINQSSSLAY